MKQKPIYTLTKSFKMWAPHRF